ncbi:MAG: hypothetical protein ABWJ42_00080, partial [Sulfolobales archaeon]
MESLPSISIDIIVSILTEYIKRIIDKASRGEKLSDWEVGLLMIEAIRRTHEVKMEALEKRLESVEETFRAKIDSLEKTLNARIEALEKRIEVVEKRLEVIEKRIDD